MLEPVIGLEVHAELQTRSKMFCPCPVVDSTVAEANTAVCPICAGMPGTLPVANRQAVEFAIRVALALQCEIAPVSIFARKNYFYPDLPKGYQISQYEQPLARNGQLAISTSTGERTIRIRRVHLEEDTGKLTHVNQEGQSFSLVDLNRAGVPLLEIVSEPDLRSAEEVRAYAVALRAVLLFLGVNSGDMQKGVLRIEPNVSVRPAGSTVLGTRTEIKNLNSFRALERSVDYEIRRQSERLERGLTVVQETLGWDESRGMTYSQRSKEEAHDYRYFPEPDLPPLVVEPEWIEAIRRSLPELPTALQQRFRQAYGLSEYDASLLATEPAIAQYFEGMAAAAPEIAPKVLANWLTGELFGLLNNSGLEITASPVAPQELVDLVRLAMRGEINQGTAKSVLAEMFSSGRPAEEIVKARGLRQISDSSQIAAIIAQVLQDNPEQVQAYQNGKDALARWFFGQVMRLAGGRANPQVVQGELERQLERLRPE